MQRFVRSLIILTSVGVICAVLSGNALAATSTDPELRAEAWSWDEAKLADRKVAVSKGVQNGVLQVRPFRLNSGLPKVKCRWFTGGVNTYLDARGREVRIRETGRVYACRDKSSPSGWRKRGGGKTMKDCWNIYYPPGKPHPPVYKGKYLVVSEFSFTAKVSVRIVLTGTVAAEAACDVNGFKAWARASGSGFAQSVATATVSARTRSRAIVLAHNRAMRDATSSEATQAMRAEAENEARLNLQASARVVCEGPPPQPNPPPTPPGPGPQPPPCTVNCQPPPKANRPPQVEIVNPPAHVYENGQVQICANFSDPDGDQLQVSWSSSGGTVSNGRECITFTAGGPGTGSVTVTVSDGKESRSATVTFPIPKDEF